MIMQQHLAHDVVERLGALGAVQFTDLNGDLTAFRRAYTPFVKRCDELEKKLKFFEQECRAHGLKLEEAGVGEFSTWHQQQAMAVAHDHHGMSLLDFWEAVVAERFADYAEVKAQRDRTAAGVHLAVQRRFVIERAAEFFAVERDGFAPAGAAAAGTGVGVGAGGLLLEREEGRGLFDDEAALHGLVDGRGRAVALRLDLVVVAESLRDDGLPVVEQRHARVVALDGVELRRVPRVELALAHGSERERVYAHLGLEEAQLLLELVAALHEGRVGAPEGRQVAVQVRELHAAELAQALDGVVRKVLLADYAHGLHLLAAQEVTEACGVGRGIGALRMGGRPARGRGSG